MPHQDKLVGAGTQRRQHFLKSYAAATTLSTRSTIPPNGI